MEVIREKSERALWVLHKYKWDTVDVHTENLNFRAGRTLADKVQGTLQFFIHSIQLDSRCLWIQETGRI